ncbi:hypothetical protein [Pantoea agglomerans]|uniref:F4 family fimbrial subunit n=1 Tax=Enterobacter agglomerans TaxID=549 RepID=UPI003208BA0A
MMKKTLIALALAATAVSGSAMAWTSDGTGGSMEFSGTLTPEAVTPWEVLVGPAVSNLNANIESGTKIATIPVNTAIPVLGIRTALSQAFQGATGITPQIDYQGAINTSQFTNGVTTLTLEVKDTSDAKIGVLTAPLSAAALYSASTTGQNSLVADASDRAFLGGLSTTTAGAAQGSSAAKALMNSINADFLANYVAQGSESSTLASAAFTDTSKRYSGAYGAGIVAGATAKLTLDNAAAGDAIAWKASLPITVSYQ